MAKSNSKYENYKKDDSTNSNLNSIVTFSDITCAAFRIRNYILRTPCTSIHLSEKSNLQLFVKKEFIQVTGSFKERGACFALMSLSDSQKKKGIITASLGNHAQAISYHAGKFKIPSTVVMPVIAPLVKTEACRQYGATVIIKGNNMKETKAYAQKYAEENKLLYINGYDDPAVIVGQGTIGLEIIEDIPDVDVVVVPVGGGGLIAGVSLAMKTLNKNIKIIGVETERCPSFSKALEQGKPVTVECDNTLADGLAVPQVGENSYKIAASLIDKMIVLKEEWISLAILRLLEQEKSVVEGAGAAGLAAVLAGHLNEFVGKKIVIILCGGNIDSNILGRCIERSLVVDGRMLKFSVKLSDRPGGVSEMCKILANLGASIKNIDHERAWLTSEVFHVVVTVTCETRNHKHVEIIKNELKKKYKFVIFTEIPELKL